MKCEACGYDSEKENDLEEHNDLIDSNFLEIYTEFKLTTMYRKLPLVKFMACPSCQTVKMVDYYEY